MKGIWQRAMAQVEFTALGGRYEHFIDVCTQQGLPISNLVPIPGGVQGLVPARHYRRAAQVGRSCRTRLRVERRRGLWFRMRWLRGRWGMVVGPVLFWVAVLAFGQVVWAVRWSESLTDFQRQQLRQGLYSMHIEEGAVLNQETVRRAEKLLLSQQPDFAWVALNFNRGRLVVEAAPAAQKPAIEGTEPGDLLAKADGLLLEVNTEQGIAAKKKGQTVAEGEVLIQGWRTDRTGAHIPTHAKGSALAQVQKVYQCSQPLTYHALVAQQGVQEHLAIQLLGRRFEWGSQPQQAQALSSTQRSPLQVFGFTLPATVERTLIVPRSTVQVQLTDQQAADYARMACYQQLYQQFPDAVILEHEEDWQQQENQVEYTLWVKFTADLVQRQESSGE